MKIGIIQAGKKVFNKPDVMKTERGDEESLFALGKGKILGLYHHRKRGRSDRKANKI